MIALIRIPLFCIGFVLINLIVLFVCVVRPFHRNNVSFAGRAYASLSRVLGLRLEIRVPESVKAAGPYVYIGNHQNTYDIFTVCGAAQPGTVTIGKKSLAWIPLFGWAFWLSGNILIDRKNGAKASDTLKQAARKIRERKLSVWVFPEGTRSNGRGLMPFKTGAFRLAKLTGEDVVMICASELHKKVAWNRWDNGTVIVQMYDPVSMDESKSIKEWSGHFQALMQQRIDKLNAEVAAKQEQG